MDPLDPLDPVDPLDLLETLAWENVVFRLSKTMISLQKKQQRAWSVTLFHAFTKKSVTLYTFLMISPKSSQSD